MQATRQCILGILRDKGEATVDEIVAELNVRAEAITAVTVRYHLDILKDERLVSTARVRRRGSPGRPQYVYVLTEQAHAYFPKNYQALTTHILEELKRNLPPEQLYVILESVARRMAQEVGQIPDELNTSPQERIMRAVDYLSEQGYQASWEQIKTDGGEGTYLLRISNCPYRQVAGSHIELCAMDTKLITNILGIQPGCAGTIAQGYETCTYEAQIIGQTR